MPPSNKEEISVSRGSSSIGAAVPTGVGSMPERRRPTVTTTDHAVSDLYLRRLEMMEQRLSRGLQCASNLDFGLTLYVLDV
jgi:hypothetical protein